MARINQAKAISGMAGHELTFTVRTRYVQALNERPRTTDLERVEILSGSLGRQVRGTVAPETVEAFG